MKEIVFDATDCIAGRLAAISAKELLKGNKVFIVNSEKAVISGDPTAILNTWKAKVDRGHPYHGPFYPRQPERILRRIIRGMLPIKKARGKQALKRLRVFVGVPEELSKSTTTRLSAAIRKTKYKYITLGELSIKLGGKRKW